MLTISSGHSPKYLTDAVAAGRENYYTGAVAAGEPPGRWSGRGAARLGLSGLVETQDMTALYEHFIDPRDDAFRDPSRWADPDTATLGHAGRRYLTEDEIYAAALEAEPSADPERRAALRLEAGKRARKNVAFLDATFSVQKSITVLHTAFEAQEVKARGAADRARSALEAVDTAVVGAPDGAVHADDGGAVHPHGIGDTGAAGAVQCTGTTAADRRAAEQVEKLAAELADAEAAEAAWARYRQAVEDAIWAGNQAALEYLADKAGYARVGHHGGAAGRWIDSHDLTVASFFQHDSRDHDPQLHIHNAILNRVEGSDGKWRTLDSRAVHKYRGAAAAVGERVTEEHLTRALGVEFATRPDGKAREIVGIDQSVMDLFSSRRRAITKKTAALVREFDTRFGRAPNSLELDRLQRTATFATRKAKSHEGETVTERLDRWDRELRAEVRGGLGQVAAEVLDQASSQRDGQRHRRGQRVKWSEAAVIETALAQVQETKAAWTAPDLTRAISDALPDHLGTLTPEQVTQLLDGLTAEALKLAVALDAQRPGDNALPNALRRADGTSAYEAPGGKLYATPAHVHTERLLAANAAAADRDAPALSADAAARFLNELREAGIELGVDQAAALRGILTSGARVETLVGPAGTGKSFVVGTLAKAWQDPDLWRGQVGGRRQHSVVGLASSQIATEVLAAEGLTARNIARWLATQDRLTTDRTRGDDRAWQLRAGDLVVVDESAMANTADLATIHAHCQTAGAKLLLTGDHRQLAAVGAGGAMELAAAAGIRHELAETRRFTHQWEGPASLRLRDGEQSVLAEYHKHGRLIDGGAIEQTEASAGRAWLADTLNGRHALMIVDSNEQAARLSAQLRAELVRLGRVDDERRVLLGLQGVYAGRGDVIQTRRNGWHLQGYRGNRRAPRNRDQFTVLNIGEDGSLVVAGIDQRTGQVIADDTLTLPTHYVAEHVALGYASTVHAAQGATVDTTHTVATPTTGTNALYVGMSRGRYANTAHVVTRAIPADAPTGAVKEAVHRSPQAVLAAAFENDDPQRSALAEATESAAEAESVRMPAELFSDACQLATAGRTARWLDQLVTDGHLSPADRVAIAAEDGSATLARLLRQVELAGHNPQQVLSDAVNRRGLHDARQITNVLHRRITETTTLDPVGDTYADWIPTVDDPQWAAYLTKLADDADQRRAQLGRKVAAEAPQWAVEALGPLPDDEAARAGWQRGAAIVAAHRELVGHDDPEDALGPAPMPGQAEICASWRAAWRALGRPEADRAEVEMSTGQLRVRIRAYEREQTWAPPYVANELAGTRQVADKHRADAAMRRAEADTTNDDSTRGQSQQQAEQASALADALDARAAQLEQADTARAEWYAHTAETRAAADRAKAELSSRQNASDEPADELVTVEEWLAAHHAADLVEDPHREVTANHQLTEVEAERSRDQEAASRDTATADGAAASVPGPAPRDIRQEVADQPESAQPATGDGDSVRVPSADETADSVRRARRALLELKQRKATEEQHATDEAAERDEELARWHADDTTTETAETPGAGHAGTDRGLVLETAAIDD